MKFPKVITKIPTELWLEVAKNLNFRERLSLEEVLGHSIGAFPNKLVEKSQPLIRNIYQSFCWNDDGSWYVGNVHLGDIQGACIRRRRNHPQVSMQVVVRDGKFMHHYRFSPYTSHRGCVFDEWLYGDFTNFEWVNERYLRTFGL